MASRLGPVQFGIDPTGSITISVTIGQLEYPWGHSKEWAMNPQENGDPAQVVKYQKGGITATLSEAADGSLDFEENKGWQWFPRKTLREQKERQEKSAKQAINNYDKAKAAKGLDPNNKTISMSSVFKVNVKAVVFAMLQWDAYDLDSMTFDATKSPGFNGSIGAALILSADYIWFGNTDA